MAHEPAQTLQLLREGVEALIEGYRVEWVVNDQGEAVGLQIVLPILADAELTPVSPGSCLRS